ncbi:MAG: hypothetical protein ACE5GX_00830 [Thermoanaerobaculia bacterium]
MAEPGSGLSVPGAPLGGVWGFVLLCLAVVSAYAAGTIWWDAAPGGTLSLIFGWSAAALLLLVTALSARKRAMSFFSRLGLGRSRLWLVLHVYGGALFLLLVLVHSGFGMPEGWVTIWLLGLSIWTVIGGLAGRGMQRWIPRLMTSGLSTEVLYERIPELVDDIRARAAELAASSATEIRDLHDSAMATKLQAPNRRWVYFFDITGGIRERLRSVRYLREKLPEEEAEKLDELEELYRAKFEIDAHYTLQQALRAWLWLHVPTSLLLLVFLGLHLWGVLRY